MAWKCRSVNRQTLHCFVIMAYHGLEVQVRKQTDRTLLCYNGLLWSGCATGKQTVCGFITSSCEKSPILSALNELDGMWNVPFKCYCLVVKYNLEFCPKFLFRFCYTSAPVLVIFPPSDAHLISLKFNLITNDYNNRSKCTLLPLSDVCTRFPFCCSIFHTSDSYLNTTNYSTPSIPQIYTLYISVETFVCYSV
jgi:hypothetical protein